MARVLLISYPFETKHEFYWLLTKNGFKVHKDFENILYDNIGNLIHLRPHSEFRKRDNTRRYNFQVNYIENHEKKEAFRIWHYCELEKLILDLKNSKDSGKPNNFLKKS